MEVLEAAQVPPHDDQVHLPLVRDVVRVTPQRSPVLAEHAEAHGRSFAPLQRRCQQLQPQPAVARREPADGVGFTMGSACCHLRMGGGGRIVIPAVRIDRGACERRDAEEGGEAGGEGGELQQRAHAGTAL